MSPVGPNPPMDWTSSAMRILTGDEIGVMNAAGVRNRIAACDRIGTLHHMARAFAPKGSTKVLSRRSLLGGLLATFVVSPFAATIAPSPAAHSLSAGPTVRRRRFASSPGQIRVPAIGIGARGAAITRGLGAVGMEIGRFPLPKPEMGYAFWQLGICARRLGALTEVLPLRK